MLTVFTLLAEDRLTVGESVGVDEGNLEGAIDGSWVGGAWVGESVGYWVGKSVGYWVLHHNSEKRQGEQREMW